MSKSTAALVWVVKEMARAPITVRIVFFIIMLGDLFGLEIDSLFYCGSD